MVDHSDEYGYTWLDLIPQESKEAWKQEVSSHSECLLYICLRLVMVDADTYDNVIQHPKICQYTSGSEESISGGSGHGGHVVDRSSSCGVDHPSISLLCLDTLLTHAAVAG